MINGPERRRPHHVLLTGATGMVGREILRGLLTTHRPESRRVTLLLREPIAPRFDRLAAFLWSFGVDLPALIAGGAVHITAGDLSGGGPTDGPPVDQVIHAAGSTRFTSGTDGDPAQTNVDGTRSLLAWMQVHGVSDLHHVSTAYVCGAWDHRQGPVPETPAHAGIPAHNAYEASKRQGEHLVTNWAGATGGRLTIHRPSIVVGRHDDGRAGAFSGVYLAFRASELLAQRHAGHTDRHRIALRIAGRLGAALDLVPVDWVADLIVGISATPALGGRIHHLTHPSPPDNAAIQRTIETAFDIAGGRFVDPAAWPLPDMTPDEAVFHRTTDVLRPYLQDSPPFDRTHTRAAERALARRCPLWRSADLLRLVDHAVAVRWGRRSETEVPTATDASLCEHYFNRHLPEQVHRSTVARRAAITATVQFVVVGVPDGAWTCRFESGRLAWIRRGRDGPSADFGYRIEHDAFRDVVTGMVEPHQAFLDGRAEIEGDVERALMMGVVLNEFNRQHPFEPAGVA